MDFSRASLRLANLAQQLRLYETPPALVNEDGSKEIKGNSNKVITQVGFPESSTSIWQTLRRKEQESEKVEGFGPKWAAVLVCLFEGDNGELRVILTKRSPDLSTYSGEVALPGGKMDEGDRDEADTATREAKEEIGLDPSLVKVVRVLEPYISKTSMRVVPVIGILTNKQAFKPIPNVGEVDVIFDAPLDMFIKDENRRAEEIGPKGHRFLVHFFDHETSSGGKFVIWGLTAAILIRTASVVYQRPPPFVERTQLLRNFL